jgi:hypothetical protein
LRGADLTVELLVIFGAAISGLVGMGVALGATIMWRLRHRVEPPPVPAWVSLVTVGSIGTIALAAALAEMWLSALALGLSGVVFGLVAVEHARRKHSRRSKPS